MPRIPIVIFAQVPPLEHGQSRMVSQAVETLRKRPEDFEIHHINTKFSTSLDDIGEGSFAKLGLAIKYLAQALWIRRLSSQSILYYVPGPVKWSSILRDWVSLGFLRLLYSRVVFHWHAIGQGEWAHGSDRLTLVGPKWMDHFARKISAWALDEPFASIAVSDNSRKDSLAIASKRELVICNGIEDPCPEFDKKLIPLKLDRQQELATTDAPCFKILFLSHGTLEKGIIDALECMGAILEHCDPSWCFEVTFAGGISDSIITRFDWTADKLLSRWTGRIRIIEKDYLSGNEKHQCFIDHDIFLAPSRWESFGLTVIEAMAYGMPIVAATSDGVKGVLPNGHPYLSPVANPPALAEKLLECCSAMRTAGSLEDVRALRACFLSHYQIRDFSAKLTDVFLELGAADGADLAALASHDEENEEDDNKVVTPYQDPKTSSASPFPGASADQCYGASVKAKKSTALRKSTPSSLAAATPKDRFIQAKPHGIAGTTALREIRITAYLADQNPGYDRSFGISRMTQVVMDALQKRPSLDIEVIVSETSQQAPESISSVQRLPWGTRKKWIRLLTDHFHPLFSQRGRAADLSYYPKGYLPMLSGFCHPSVVTIHDTIIQYDEDNYPQWRNRFEYGYWEMLLKHTLREADAILTVSETSKGQIESFMDRHGIPRKAVEVTYEPCLYERIPQPVAEEKKKDFVIHLASCEPHKRTEHLIRWWDTAMATGRTLPTLHLIGNVPPEAAHLVGRSKGIVKRPFLDDLELQDAYRSARALILPSEIEGFGLPALEAYYLGTPVCFVRETSVEEILAVATGKGGFTLDESDSLFAALDEVLAMEPAEIRGCGLKLRETYAAEKVAERMMAVFHKLAGR